jgi:plastocyanin
MLRRLVAMPTPTPTPATYAYHCPIHSGMTGSIVVQ